MAPQPSQFLLVCSLTLSACSYLTVLWLAIKRPPNAPYPRARWLGVSFVVGSAAGGILVWNLMPALLPFGKRCGRRSTPTTTDTLLNTPRRVS